MLLFVSLFTEVCDVIEVRASVLGCCGALWGGSVVGLELRGCAFLVASIIVFLASPAVFGLVWESCWGLSGTLS